MLCGDRLTSLHKISVDDTVMAIVWVNDSGGPEVMCLLIGTVQVACFEPGSIGWWLGALSATPTLLRATDSSSSLWLLSTY